MDIVHGKCSFLIAFGYILVFVSVSSVKVQENICLVPPQPANGYRQLYKSQCPSPQSDCDVQEGTKLPAWSLLMYTCNPGYHISGFNYVLCDDKGNWTHIPFCTELCQPLTSTLTYADCKLNNKPVSCEAPVFPGTIAVLRCRPGYHKVVNFESKQNYRITCNNDGQWEPQPSQCSPICGLVFPPPPSLIVAANGYLSTLSKIPWHATLYREKIPNGRKYFVCGATITKEKFLLTAAHCVYDETNKLIIDPNKCYVTTGNIYRDYDSILHDEKYVKKARVKNIFVPCNYEGYEGNYANDIAIIEIEKPFVLSRWLVPACLNDDLIESGFGVASGFGRTHKGPSSFVLQSVTLPYVPLHQCKSSKSYVESENLITMDKFCAGYTNGTAVCDGDSGGGLVFKTGNLWYLRGIVSLSLGKILTGGTTICDINSYSLYTHISTHINWIKDIISRSETSQSLPTCQKSTMTNTTFTSPSEFNLT